MFVNGTRVIWNPEDSWGNVRPLRERYGNEEMVVSAARKVGSLSGQMLKLARNGVNLKNAKGEDLEVSSTYVTPIRETNVPSQPLNTPEPGTRMWWKMPSELPTSSRYLRYLIIAYGTEEVTIAEVYPNQLSVIVTLKRNGEYLREGWKGNPEEEPADFRGEPLKVNALFLVPLETISTMPLVTQKAA